MSTIMGDVIPTTLDDNLVTMVRNVDRSQVMKELLNQLVDFKPKLSRYCKDLLDKGASDEKYNGDDYGALWISQCCKIARFTVLKLSFHRPTARGIKFLMDESTSVRQCWFGYNNNFNNECLRIVSNSIKKKNNVIQLFALPRSCINNDGLKNLTIALTSKHSRINFLNLSENYITEKGMGYLCRCISKNGCNGFLKTLYFDGVRMTHDCWKMIANALTSKECKIHYLHLCHTLFNADAANILFGTLSKKGSSVKEITLRCNNVDDEIFSIIYKHMKSGKINLNGLNLANNHISNDSVEKLIDLIDSTNVEMKTFTLYDNAMSGVPLEKLIECLQKHKIRSYIVEQQGGKPLSDGTRNMRERDWKKWESNSVRLNPKSETSDDDNKGQVEGGTNGEEDFDDLLGGSSSDEDGNYSDQVEGQLKGSISTISEKETKPKEQETKKKKKIGMFFSRIFKKKK